MTDITRNEYLKIRAEAKRLARRHNRSESLIRFRGDSSFRQDGDLKRAIHEMRKYCHTKSGVCGDGTG